jgi:hypothetical protein
MDCVAQRVLDASDLRRDRGMSFAGVLFRDDDERSESPIHIHSEDLSIDADMPLSRLALATFPTRDVRLSCYEIPFPEGAHSLSHFHDLTREFVPDDSWGMYPARRPGVPSVNVEVRATHTGKSDADLHPSRADVGLGDLSYLYSRGGLGFDDGLQGATPSRILP